MRHLLVTNDFPPKLGGIQSYLWELWRRLPADEVTVLTTPHDGAAAWDAQQPFRVVRSKQPVLLPNPVLRRQIDALADEVGAELVVLDPALPLGLLGPRLDHPYALVLHGAEITVPGRVWGTRNVLAHVLREARVIVSAGDYAADEAERAAGSVLPIAVVPPGVDTERFRPVSDDDRRVARARFGLDPDALVVVSVSRLVPRKGMDVLILAAARLAERHPRLQVAIGGGGRDASRLERLVESIGAPVRLLGRVPEPDLPTAYQAGDVFAMLCRTRWAGLEQEGFGIVFQEAAATGIAQVAGESGGSAEAVVDGETGVVVRQPGSVDLVVDALDGLLAEPALRAAMGRASRERAVSAFSYDRLADRLGRALAGLPVEHPLA
jgi:phosphatidyl-myo-inositol dimannoside synthase